MGKISQTTNHCHPGKQTTLPGPRTAEWNLKNANRANSHPLQTTKTPNVIHTDELQAPRPPPQPPLLPWPALVLQYRVAQPRYQNVVGLIDDAASFNTCNGDYEKLTQLYTSPDECPGTIPNLPSYARQIIYTPPSSQPFPLPPPQPPPYNTFPPWPAIKPPPGNHQSPTKRICSQSTHPSPPHLPQLSPPPHAPSPTHRKDTHSSEIRNDLHHPFREPKSGIKKRPVRKLCNNKTLTHFLSVPEQRYTTTVPTNDYRRPSVKEGYRNESKNITRTPPQTPLAHMNGIHQGQEKVIIMPLPPPQPPPSSWPAPLDFGRRRKLWHIVLSEQKVPTYLRKTKKDPKWILRGIQYVKKRRYCTGRSSHDVLIVSTQKHYRTQAAKKKFTTTHKFNIIWITFLRTISKSQHKTNKQQNGDNSLCQTMVPRTARHSDSRQQRKIYRPGNNIHNGTNKKTATWQYNKNKAISCPGTSSDSGVQKNSTTSGANQRKETTTKAPRPPTKMKWPPWPGPPPHHFQMTHTTPSPGQRSSLHIHVPAIPASTTLSHWSPPTQARLSIQHSTAAPRNNTHSLDPASLQGMTNPPSTQTQVIYPP